IPGGAGDFWRQSPDPFSVARHRTPVIHEPGTVYGYSNPGMAMLAYAVTACYRHTPYTNIRQLLWERILKPIGIRNGEWSVGYNKTFEADGLQLVANWGGAAFTPRATARIGRLMLHNGNWQGTQLIDSSWIEKMTHYAGMPMERDKSGQVSVASGLCWYTNATGIWAHAPRDTYYGSGANNQHLIVIPSLHLIVVRYGRDMHDAAKGQSFHYGTEHYLVNLLMDALVQPPCPMSKKIKGVQFSPASTIIRKACDSDNWPLTWADDDALYTAYGDGSGFDPKVPEKLSLGLAKITGGPENFTATNIRSVTGEQKGHGRTGKKASGILMVKGILYLWLRNANHDGKQSQLAWSDDHGKTWQYCSWNFPESFGCPAFLNFGKNYHQARDGYVYLYSHDENDAYKIADQMVMARVPINRIRQEEAYEFFKGLDFSGHALWTRLVQDRKPVFVHPAGCYRNSISYNAGLRRYLWCQTLAPVDDHTDARFSGGLGIFEAAEPWGPWYTVFYTKEWDTGPGETSSFPTKWMSRDGKTCYLVFSGHDCFSVRKVVFLLSDRPKTSPASGIHKPSR
ncbi:MAG TPA: DUF4185 domain-containing protein, partial [Sediminibacterium sp.]|nr:DUF4185 domain-containing protein [Sediminibacterium sp.]